MRKLIGQEQPQFQRQLAVNSRSRIEAVEMRSIDAKEAVLQTFVARVAHVGKSVPLAPKWPRYIQANDVALGSSKEPGTSRVVARINQREGSFRVAIVQ